MSHNVGNSAKDEIDGVTWDLHSFFLGADFSGNPERITHTYFKPHLGNVESQEVKEFYHRTLYTDLNMVEIYNRMILLVIAFVIGFIGMSPIVDQNRIKAMLLGTLWLWRPHSVLLVTSLS